MRLFSLLAAAGVACSHPSPTNPDAASRDAPGGDPDAALDAAPDAAPDQVTIRLIGRDSGAITGTVLFYSPAGTLLERVTATAPGTASATVPAGSSVTVVETGTPGFNGPPYFTTFLQVEPGDELLVGDLETLSSSVLGNMSFALPPGPQPSSEYRLSSSCANASGTASPISGSLFGCVPEGPVIVTARQPGTETPTGYIFDPAVPLSVGSTATIDGDWQPPITFNTAVTGLPPFTRPRLTMQRLYQGRGVFLKTEQGAFQSTGVFNATSVQPTGGDGTLTFLELDLGTGPNSSNYEILEYRDGTPNDFTGDIAADLVALPTNPIELVGELAPGGPSGINGVSWTMSGTTGFDGVVLRTMMFGPSGGLFAWTIVAPPPATTTPEVRVPPLPADLAPLWAANTYLSTWVFVAETPAKSYAEFRHDAEPQAFLPHWMFRPTSPRKVRLGIAVRQVD